MGLLSGKRGASHGDFLVAVFDGRGVEFAEVRGPAVAAFIGGLSDRYQPRTVEHAATALRVFVNVATLLLIDVLGGAVDAAVVISNDSDLKLPINIARRAVPVGLVNPTKGYPAGALNASPGTGAGGHWWYQLIAADFSSAQLPTTIGHLTRPQGW